VEQAKSQTQGWKNLSQRTTIFLQILTFRGEYGKMVTTKSKERSAPPVMLPAKEQNQKPFKQRKG
jgi:hypothetical protein